MYVVLTIEKKTIPLEIVYHCKQLTTVINDDAIPICGRTIWPLSKCTHERILSMPRKTCGIFRIHQINICSYNICILNIFMFLFGQGMSDGLDRTNNLFMHKLCGWKDLCSVCIFLFFNTIGNNEMYIFSHFWFVFIKVSILYLTLNSQSNK